ncbi:MAG: hypothetical protein JOZ77_01145 [Candidatus Eremiobacteraeota bacterium]|nr:hypothetical protein [Candidatus Eremiobacteraeota bacterium]
MRKVLTTLTVMLVVSLQMARADVNPYAAPADEYFGPYKQSILEIRNRLNDYDLRDSGYMLDPAVPSYLDHLQLAIVDWQRKYPRDPWLPATFAHLIREYWRAGQASSEHGMSALAFMRSAYPDSSETTRSVALIYGSNGDLSDTARDRTEETPVAEYAPVAPVAEYAPPVAPVEDSPAAADGLPSYATPLSDDVSSTPPMR